MNGNSSVLRHGRPSQTFVERVQRPAERLAAQLEAEGRKRDARAVRDLLCSHSAQRGALVSHNRRLRLLEARVRDSRK